MWAHEFLTEKNAALARLFLSWDRPDREESDFTQPLYEEFREWILPALRGGTGQPGELAAAELARAERCLRLESFDPALAVRCLVAAGLGASPRLLAALTGDSPGASIHS